MWVDVIGDEGGDDCLESCEILARLVVFNPPEVAESEGDVPLSPNDEGPGGFYPPLINSNWSITGKISATVDHRGHVAWP